MAAAAAAATAAARPRLEVMQPASIAYAGKILSVAVPSVQTCIKWSCYVAAYLRKILKGMFRLPFG